jgi:OmcA/MtrC family decaheme c-type cytochrome
VCHAGGAFADAAAAHAIDGQALVTNASAAVSGANLVFSFTVEVDGVPTAGYDTLNRFLRSEGLGTVTEDILASATLGDGADAGDYTITIAGGAAVVDDSRYLFRVRIAAVGSSSQIYGWVDSPASPFAPAAVSAESCTNCHGPEGIDVHGGYYAAADGAEPCLVCHGASDYVGRGPVPSLGEVTHKYHAGIWEDDGEFVDVTYPTYMTNCSVCHDTDATLAAANNMPVLAETCFTCHGSLAGFTFPVGGFQHVGVDDIDCVNCHAGDTVVDYHDGIVTERGGIIFAGADTSVTEGAKFDWQITGVADDGANLSITWTASYDGVPFDPCNVTATATTPVFFADLPVEDSPLSILRNYAQGGDYILGTNPNAAGQPGGDVDVTVDNTTCEGLVATTVVPVEDVDAMYGRVAIQGKPRVPNIDPTPDPDFAEEYGDLMPVRAFTPTFDWELGTDDPAPERRAVVNSGECLKCHVGSMYQHGGNRVDNVDMCYLCHNTAANDQYVRVDTFDVDASEAYDGRAGQNFGMKEMLHAVHSAGATGAPIVIYRGRGIYAWAGDESLLSNWPGSGRFPVFGSDDGSGNPVEQNHTFHVPTYPRALNACGACHVEGFEILPSALEAMASTVETGDAPFGDQVNDVLEGALASSCMTCHRSDDPSIEAALKAHAYQNGWAPQAFPEGRKTIIDAVK